MGVTLGVRNAKSVKNLLERMKQMVERRKEKIWDSDAVAGGQSAGNAVVTTEEAGDNYRMNNIITLRQMAKERGIVFLHKTKDEIIQLLEAFDAKKNSPSDNTDHVHRNPDELVMDYEKMTSGQLKELAKNRGFIRYNNVNNTNLRAIHRQYDEAVQTQKKQSHEAKVSAQTTDGMDKAVVEVERESAVNEFQLVAENGDTFPIMIRQDGMVNVTQLCNAMGKDFYDYHRTKQTQAFIDALRSEPNIHGSEILVTKKGGVPKLQGTWCHRLIAIDCARWLHPRFALQVIKWTDEILTKGSVRIERPLLPILDRGALDIEAEELERKCNTLQNSNQFVLYLAYIGNGLIKIGSSDRRIQERESKHRSCESLYPQFRFIHFFAISSGIIERTIHHLLDKYRHPFNKQKEVYKPSSTLREFIEMVDTLLKEHDLEMKVREIIIENLQLRNQMLELEKENMRLRYELGKPTRK